MLQYLKFHPVTGPLISLTSGRQDMRQDIMLTCGVNCWMTMPLHGSQNMADSVANGERFRKMILSRGGTEEVGALYRAFRGRNPDVKPLLEERGLTKE